LIRGPVRRQMVPNQRSRAPSSFIEPAAAAGGDGIWRIGE
jgi:hypothetical protein